jgi:hypothetical protein
MRNLSKLTIPFGAICLAVGLADSPAQPPGKSKSKTPDVVDKAAPTTGLVFEVRHEGGSPQDRQGDSGRRGQSEGGRSKADGFEIESAMSEPADAIHS